MRILLLLATGCVTATAVPAAFHPTASDTDRSVGLSIGGAYVKDSNTKILTIPYGEGSVRIPMSPGQLSIHVAPDVAYLGYRYDVSKLADGGVGFGIEPLVGGSYYSETSTDDQGMETKQSAFALMLGIAPIISFKAGPGFAYFVPKLGYQYVKELDAPAGTMNDSSKLYVVGLSAGIDLGNGVSIELAVHRVDNADDRTPDPEAAWVIVPSVGIRH